MYVIYQVIDPATGEVRPYTSDLADQVQELRAARLTRVQQQLAALRSGSAHRHRDLQPAPVDEGAELWRLFRGGDL